MDASEKMRLSGAMKNLSDELAKHKKLIALVESELPAWAAWSARTGTWQSPSVRSAQADGLRKTVLIPLVDSAHALAEAARTIDAELNA